MSSIGSRLAGASPQFGAGYPQQTGYKPPPPEQQSQQYNPHHQQSYNSPGNHSPQVVQNHGYQSPNVTGVIPPSQVTPHRPSPAQSFSSTPSHSFNPPTHSSVNSPYYGSNPSPQQNSPYPGGHQHQQQPNYASPGYGQQGKGYQAVPNYVPNPGGYGQQVAFSGAGYGRSPLTTGFVGQVTNMVAGKVSTEYAEKAFQKSIDLKDWGLKTYRCTKQLYNEKTGKGTRTVDFQLDEKIQTIKNTKARYTRLLELTSLLSSQLSSVKCTHRAMAEVFNDLSGQQPELIGELSVNGSVYHHITDQSDTLVKVLLQFADSLKTLVEKTIQDSLDTITNYERCRIEFDAYRNQMEELQMTQRNTMSGRLRETQFKMDQARAIYEQKRADVGVKLELLDENRVKVMRQQCLLLHSATVAYFNGSYTKVIETVKVLEKYQQHRHDTPPSFLEIDHHGNGSGTPPCGRTPVGEEPPQMFDMLGEPIVSQRQQVATPPIQYDGVQIVGTNYGPVADLMSQEPTEPSTPEPTNGVLIVGLVSHHDEVEPAVEPAEESTQGDLLINTDDDLSLQFREASI